MCYSSRSSYGRVRSFFFRFFFSYLVLSAFDRWPLLAYSYTYTHQGMLTPNVISSPSSVVLTHGIRVRLVWYVVCYSSPSTYGRVRSFLSFFFSYLVLCAFDSRPLLAYSYTYTHQRMLTPRVISSLSSMVLTHGITNGSLSPECLLYVQRISASFFFHPPVSYVRVL